VQPALAVCDLAREMIDTLLGRQDSGNRDALPELAELSGGGIASLGFAGGDVGPNPVSDLPLGNHATNAA
jgi:hypothetical protein